MPMIEVTTSELVDQRKAKILKAGLGENIISRQGGKPRHGRDQGPGLRVLRR